MVTLLAQFCSVADKEPPAGIASVRHKLLQRDVRPQEASFAGDAPSNTVLAVPAHPGATVRAIRPFRIALGATVHSSQRLTAWCLIFEQPSYRHAVTGFSRALLLFRHLLTTRRC